MTILCRNALLGSLLGLVLSASAQAHEFLIKPDQTEVGAGDTLGFSVMVTEVYIKPDRLPPETTAVSLMDNGGASQLSLTKDEAGKVLRGAVAAPDDGTFLITGTAERTRPVRTKKDEPVAQAPILKMENFGKALINARMGDADYAQVLGTRLEIVPVTNPATVGAGDTLTFKVLFDGKPVATRFQATYDGFSDKEHGYVVKTETGADGLVSFAATEPGLWMVRTKVTRDEVTDTHQKYEASASFVFEVLP